MTDAAYSCSLAQTNFLRIGQGSLLTDDGMVAPGCRHANLIPSLPFARGITASVQYRGNLVVAVANSHTTDDIQRLHRRAGFRCGPWPLHRKLRVHDDLFDGCAEDHLLECRRTVITLPDFGKAITHRVYSDFLFD